MSTIATANVRALASGWVKLYKTGVNAGIVGDQAHQREGGYHISIEDQPSSNYSVVRPLDKAPPGKWRRDAASAVDQAMAKSDMVLCYQRVRAVWKDRTDPRGRYINAFNGWNGTGDAVRLDFDKRTEAYATPDHKTHSHFELHRAFVEDPLAVKAALSVLAGESKAKWLAENGGIMEPMRNDPDFKALIMRVHRGIENLQDPVDIGLKDKDGKPITEPNPLAQRLTKLEEDVAAILKLVTVIAARVPESGSTPPTPPQ